LDVLLRHVDGTPPVFEYHPFRFVNFKEKAYIRKQMAQCTSDRIPGCGSEFFIDFGFMWVSAEDYNWPNKALDRIVHLYDRHYAYLLIVDSEFWQVWAFLTANKEPPQAILRTFMKKFGLAKGIIWTDQGGKLARREEFRKTMLKEFNYVLEPTGANSPSQNGGA
jgi:hypothetical protein